MSTDFEVHPIGTTAELRKLREFARKIIDLNSNYGSIDTELLSETVVNLEVWFQDHNEKHPL
jgi:hypothetical protein